MARQHLYSVEVQWTGDLGSGTATYAGYSRDHIVRMAGKPDLPGSSDPAFRGDGSRYNPEELLVASLSTCHMLWYLHLASEAGLVLTSYVDEASGTMEEGGGRGGRFTQVVLRPRVRVSGDFDRSRAEALHHRAHDLCFIANSVNFPVIIEPSFD